LVRTEKFGALGELSTGVAHDLRNPLGAIRNGIFFLKSLLVKAGQITPEPRVTEYLQVMDDQITQCDKIIEDLISFTRISSPSYMAVNLGEVLKTTLGGIDIPDGITVNNRFGLKPVNVQADPDQLSRVFTNLIVNANEAMVDGGRWTIAVQKWIQWQKSPSPTPDQG
jgi:signal transduction histidine kinase